MKLNTNMLWLFLVSGTLAVGQNTAPCPAGSRTGSADLAGQSSTSGRPAVPASKSCGTAATSASAPQSPPAIGTRW